MSFGSLLDTKERVKQAIDIVELVGKHVRLRRQGRNYVALCPWHDDSRPSLQVNPERQSWKCWVCDIGGDVFSFVMQMDGVAFPEALAMLAEQTGIPLKPQQSGRRQGGSVEDKRSLLGVMAWAEQQYHQCLLRDADAEPARRYLQERGIAPESVQSFHLGFSPNRWDWLLRRAQSEGIGAKTLESVGLLAQSPESGNTYDRFRGRVLFSIRDTQSRPIALGGRVLPETGSTSPAKYINSPETPLFRKHETLYGLDIARTAIHKSGAALVMEGYTDVIVAHQCGFRNAVAVLGTALGQRHIQVLRRFADRIVLVLDGDEAGQKRTNEVLELFVGEGVDLRIAVLPDELDPCDLLLERGPEAFQQCLDASCDALEHAFRVSTRGIDLDGDVHRASQALERLVSIVAKAPRLRPDSANDERFREEKILQRLSTSFRVPEQSIRERLVELRRGGQRQAERAASRPLASGPSAETSEGRTPAAAPDRAPDAWQRELLELLIRYPECLARARSIVQPAQLPSSACRKIYETMCNLADEDVPPSFDRLMLEFDEPAVQSLLVELDENGSAKAIADPPMILEEWIRNYQRTQAERQYPHVAGLLREKKLDDEQEMEVLLQFVKQQKARQGISEPTEG